MTSRPGRRTFLASSAAAAVGLGGTWIGTSSAWAARFTRERLAEVGRDVPPAPHRPDPHNWSDQAVTLAWLGHASVLLNIYGVRVLLDPALFPRIGVDAFVGTIGPLRLTASALAPRDLPDLDLVLVTHAHFDHLDTPSLASVRGRPAAVMAPATSDLLPRRRRYASVQEVRWNEAVRVPTPRGEILVRGLEVQHWGARIRSDSYRGYTGFVIEREGCRLLLGGDTALTPAFRDHRRHGPFDAAVMPIGAYDPWIRNHCTPEQAVAMADAAGARLFVPVHHQSFRLSQEPFLEPIERAEAALAQERGRLAVREIGETVVVRS
jgi:L-ascorbate metabolism protein UlaG (beta-lactamase superfamily)